jgi:hypothetical protein
MAPRFEVGQIRIPGIVQNGELVAHPDWFDFVQAWTSFPAGHDDILDAAYWSIDGAFTDVVPGFVSIYKGNLQEQLTVGGKPAKDDEGKPIRTPVDDHGRPLRPIGTGRQRVRMGFREGFR